MGGTEHIVHIVTGAGEGTLSNATGDKLRTMKKEKKIQDFWPSANSGGSGLPTSYFVLFKKQEED